MRNPFEMWAFHVERSGWMEMHRRYRNLEELSDRSNGSPWLSFQDLQNSSIDIFKRGRPELGRSFRSERCNLILCGQYFTLFPSNASSW
jgi:hypothetical protein